MEISREEFERAASDAARQQQELREEIKLLQEDLGEADRDRDRMRSQMRHLYRQDTVVRAIAKIAGMTENAARQALDDYMAGKLG